MKSDLPNFITWLIFTLFFTILVSACQPAVMSDPSSSPYSTVPSRTDPPPTQPSPEPIGVQVEPTATSRPATQTPITINVQDTGGQFCENGPQDVSSPATPSPQAGISMEIDSMFPPAPPAIVEAVYSASGILLTWGGTGTDVDQFYKIYQREEGDDCWQFIGIASVEGDNKGGYEFNVAITVQTETQNFAITTVDIYGNESGLSIAEAFDSDS
ncbi:hypothetical protein ACFLY4_00500 [Chloroflexota bacterium]